MEVFNLTENLEQHSFLEEKWADAVLYTRVCLLAVACLGILGNYLVIITTAYLPESTTKHLIKYLAVWDALAVFQCGIVRPVRIFTHFLMFPVSPIQIYLF